MAENETFRILIATDNHLGVWEGDEVRKDDSFQTFDEILRIAVAQNADMVLLGGDLFHDNKPSRRTVVRAMESLSRHCLNDRPITFQVLSDQSQNFTTGRVNYENPNYNIGLPVFTIHGNHDDPAGADNLSAVDILATGNLVNYFGKFNITGAGAGKIRISPVLLQKGNTKLALYGLGNIRDERLCRLFSTPNSVEWLRPAAAEGIRVDDWFNVFVLHQNRVPHTQAAKNCLREGHLPQFLDLVVWGHEHECVADPWESVEGNGKFSVMQPGSSVATALSEGESKRKHVVLLEVQGMNWRTIKFPLETVRPFVFGSVALAGQPNLDPEEPSTVSKFLTDKVTSMIAEALRGRPSTAPPLLPLVRLRVDYTGFSTINTQRFGHGFVGKVANPHDIILWQKAAVRRARDAASAGAGAAGGVPHPDGADEQKIEDLIAAHLHQNLEILPETELTDALRDYVDKDVKSAINDTVGRALQETQAAAAKDGVGHGAPANADVDGDAAMIDAGGENSAAERPLKKPKKEEDELAAAIASAAQKRKASAAVAATLRRARETQPATETATGAAGAPSASIIAPFEDMAEDEPGPSTKSRGRAAVKAKPPRAPAAALDAAASKPRGRRTAGPTASALGMEPLGLTAATEAATPASRAGRTRTAAAAAKHKLSAYRGAVDDDRSGDEDVRERDLMEEDADPISDSEDDDLMEEEVVASVQPSARRRGAANRRAAPGNVLGSAAQTISLLDSDDEDEVGEGRGRGGRTQGTVVGPTPSAAAAGRSQLTLGRLGASQAGNRWGSLK